MSARVSSELTGAQSDGVKKFLEPLIATFDTESWCNVGWAKFVMILVVVNGGSSSVT